MNKYQEALDSIKYTVVDIAADGYHEPKTVEDFNYEQCLLMQELVDKATPRKPLLYSNDEGSKTDFALKLLTDSAYEDFTIPLYIQNGLIWLNNQDKMPEVVKPTREYKKKRDVSSQKA